VLAADGSQIYPDRHGLALYYLINVGSIVFRHGLAQAPLARSQPKVFYEDADLYEEDGGMRPSALIDVQRSTAELGELAELAATHANGAPVVAFLDNPLLLYVTLQTPDEQLVAKVIGAYLDQLDRVQDAGAAIAGVVDRPRAASVVRLVHLSRLGLEETFSRERLHALGSLQYVTDRLLFSFLQPGERSALFVNAAPDNDRYRQRGHTVAFFYVNAGGQDGGSILRVEVPKWVGSDRPALDLVHAAVVEQCRVSNGFPYVLMRAHELAVVTMKERRAFDEMVLGALIRRGMSPSVSQKAQGKAWTGAAKGRFRK
jgi:hypothetical protein